MSTVVRKADRVLLAGLVTIVVTLVACFAIANAEEPNKAAGKLQLSPEDAQFVQQAAKGGNAEVMEAKLAQKKAENEKVKAAAEQLEKDHTAANERLRQIVESHGVQVPKDPAEAREPAMELLRDKSGRAFDQEYVRGQVAAHKRTIELFEKQARDGKNPQLKAFANGQLPTLKHHLEMMQELERMQTASK
jgi:putative membrane protein